MSSPISDLAGKAADLIWAAKTPDFSADRLAKALSISRAEAVWVMKELDAAGHGRFVVGRREHPSRFLRGLTHPAHNSMQEESSVPNLEPQNAIISGPKLAAETQTLILLRNEPFGIVVPANLTRAEADRISKWLEVVVVD